MNHNRQLEALRTLHKLCTTGTFAPGRAALLLRLKESSLDNRRAGPRSDIRLPILLKAHSDDVERPVRLHDMSAQGFALYSDQPLQPLSQIEVILMVPYEISLTKMLAVKVPAEVLRVEESEGSGHHRVAARLRSANSEPAVVIAAMGHA
ncbi:MAG TPA: PilZ domain-containing protein [Terriglobales bacterium]|nr:PilZ domain-containing protein [Terriglobales bacterium]